jgi:hypothetical protein
MPYLSPDTITDIIRILIYTVQDKFLKEKTAWRRMKEKAKDGDIYYLNSETKETTYSKPPVLTAYETYLTDLSRLRLNHYIKVEKESMEEEGGATSIVSGHSVLSADTLSRHNAAMGTKATKTRVPSVPGTVDRDEGSDASRSMPGTVPITTSR